MIKPNFIDVVEYVKDGQEDPEMEKMLSLHPDGPELLKQARFICKMLENEAKESDAGGIAALYSLDVAAFDRVDDAMSMESASEPEEDSAVYRIAEMRAPALRQPSIAQMLVLIQ